MKELVTGFHKTEANKPIIGQEQSDDVVSQYVGIFSV